MIVLPRCSARPDAESIGIIGLLLFTTCFAKIAIAQNIVTPTEKHWVSVADKVYQQEVGERIATNKPVTAVAELNGQTFAVVDNALKLFKNGSIHDLAATPKKIHRLRKFGKVLWALSAEGVYRLTRTSWVKIDDRPFVDICQHLGETLGATKDDIFRLEADKFVSIKPKGGYLTTDTTLIKEDYTQELPDPIQLGPLLRIASFNGTIYILRQDSLALLDGKVFTPNPFDFGRLPSTEVRDMAVVSNRLYVGTAKGLGELRGATMTSIKGADGLPVEDVTCVAPGLANDVWIGTSQGAIRKVGDEYQYFGAQNWLPDGHVNDIAVGEHAVYVATNAGIGIIRYENYTLLKKAAWYEREIEEWGFRRLGFLNEISWSGEKEGWIRGISDNDGGNLAHYLAAMSFKYAATGDEKARLQAVEAFNAMNWLQTITGKPGLIARAVWSIKGDKGKREERGSGGLPAKWFPTKDGNFLWKGDTSSDEVNAHFYAVSLFHDLAAKGREKDRARDHVASLASHIMDNGWILRDADGKPTRWGRWDPKYLHSPYGIDSIGLNGMAAQTYMHTAFGLTGDPKFQSGLKELIKFRYQTYTVRQRLTFPPDALVPWDDELAFFCYQPLLRYARDPELRSIYLRSIERTWELLRNQQLPYFNFIYGALTGNDCEVPQAVAHLREWPLDLVSYSYKNSHRADLGAIRNNAPLKALSARETGPNWGSGVSLQYDGGNNGHSVTVPSGWLEDYWMGRYYGFIASSKTKDAEATISKPRPQARNGAAPYAGPVRPIHK